MRALSLAYTSIIGLMLLAILCSGCVVLDKRYVRHTDAHVARCRTTGWGWLGVPVAFVDQSLCGAQLERAGFVADK